GPGPRPAGRRHRGAVGGGAGGLPVLAGQGAPGGQDGDRRRGARHPDGLRPAPADPLGPARRLRPRRRGRPAAGDAADGGDDPQPRRAGGGRRRRRPAAAPRPLRRPARRRDLQRREHRPGAAGRTAANPDGMTSRAVRGLRVDGHSVAVDAQPARARLEFLAPDVVRTSVAPTGRFSETDGIVVKTDYAGVSPDVSETDDYLLLGTEAVAVRVYKADLRLGLYRPGNAVRIVEEVVGLHVDGAVTTQRLTQAPGEQYFGAGMQNGRFSHRHATVNVAVSYEWNEGGWPNSVPFVVSTGGYGLFRNTFAA